MEICTNCIQPNTRPGIYFNEEGVCGACLWGEEKNKIDWDLRCKELQDIALWAKKNSKGDYDCTIGVSGGKDSTKQAITARDKLDLNCLLVNCEPENITDIGRKNIENLKNLGFDVVTIRPNPNVMKRLIRYDFFEHLNPVKATEFALYSSTYIIAEKFKIPLIIQGETQVLTLGTRLISAGQVQDALNVDQNMRTLSQGCQEYLNVDGIKKRDLFLFRYNKENLKELGIKGIWLQYYLKEWSYRGNAEFSKKYGLTVRENFNPKDIGTYVDFSALDSDLNHVNQMLKYIKFGFGFCMDHACYDIRDGHITRNEAMNLVKDYDGKCSEEYIKKFCDYVEITIDKFWDTANSFRGPMWSKNEDNEWINEYWNKIKEN
jgi:N-acetyl sugar amidotransferase